MKFLFGKKRLRATLIVLALSFCTAAQAAEPEKDVIFEPISVSGIKPLEVKNDQLKPGLSTIYFMKFFERDLTLLPKTESSQYVSFKGKPILELNHQFGNDNVFDSGSGRGVGLRMRGLLQFRVAGTYELQALSNDGIIMYIADVLTLSDPEQHSDRLSNIASVHVETPGWYPVVIEYFQRKGTAALKLFWKTPAGSSLEPVPANAYAHLP